MKTLGIIGGNGIMGKCFAEAFKRQNFSVLVSGRKTKLTNKELVKKSDIVIFSVPIHVTEKVIKEVLPYTRKNQLLMDFTSLKVFPIKTMRRSPAEVIGLHPMFRPGPDGLKKQTIVMCAERAQKKTIASIKKILTNEGAKITEMTAKEHDHLMAIIQVLLHFHTVVMGHTLRKLGVSITKTLSVASPIYRVEMDMIGRLFSQDPLLYAAIEMLNPENKKVIRTLQKEGEKLAKMVAKKDMKQFQKAFKKTADFLGGFKDQAMEEVDHLLSKLKKTS